MLSQTERKHLAFVIKTDCPPTTSCEFWDAIELAKTKLPDGILRWSEQVFQHGVGLLTNGVLDFVVPPTPVEMFQDSDDADYWERLSVLLSQLFGECLRYQGKVYPGVVHDIFPMTSKSDKELGSGYSPLAWHVEDGFFDDRPDWLSLYCLRGEPATNTYVARVDDFEFSSQDEMDLYAREFTLGVDTSFEESFQNFKRYVRVLSRSSGVTEIVYDPAFTVVDNPSDRSLLDTVRKQANRWKYSRSLTQGDFFVLNNRRCVHARGKIQRSAAVGKRRWLKRCCVWGSAPANTDDRLIMFDRAAFQ